MAIATLSTGAALVLALACLQAGAGTPGKAEPGAAGGLPGRLLPLVYLPLLVPQIAILPGLQGLALRLGIEGGLLAVAAAHLVFVLPYVLLTLAGPFAAWDRRIGIAAATLGAKEARIFWRLRLPMLVAPVMTAAAVGIAVSVGQYLPSLLIGGGRIETLTTEAVALASGGNRRLIGALAVLQMALPALAFALAVGLPALIWRKRRGMRGMG